MDCNMFVMGGIEVLIILCKVLEVDILIVVFIVNVFVEDREECLVVGMIDFLVKFLDKDMLLVCIKKYIG